MKVIKMKPKTKVILGFAIFFITAAAIIGYGYYAELYHLY